MVKWFSDDCGGERCGPPPIPRAAVMVWDTFALRVATRRSRRGPTSYEPPLPSFAIEHRIVEESWRH